MRFEGKAGDEIYLPKLNKFIRFNSNGYFETEEVEVIEALGGEVEIEKEVLLKNNLKSNKK